MIGKKISNFYITEQIGEGGMGTVYKATDRHLNRTIALKMLHPNLVNDPDHFRRFQNEAQLSARITHPNVATLFDFQQSENHNFIVMEYVEGMPLDEVLKLQGRLSARDAVMISLQVLEGLGAAHDMGIMHRDLKPGNIMINTRGYVKLMDFGIARLENTERLTRQNSVIGTLEYLSPELLKGGTPSKRADLYAAGVLLHEMLTGRTLFQGESEASLMYQIAHTQAKIEIPGADRKLVQIIRKLTHRQADKRYRSTQEVIHELEKLYTPGRINTLLLSEKVAPEASEKQKVLPLSLPKSLPVPSLKVPKATAVKMPFEVDTKIIAVAVGVSLLILLIGMFSGSAGEETDPASLPSHAAEIPSSTQAPALASSTESNRLGLPVQDAPRSPLEVKPLETEEEANPQAPESRRQRSQEESGQRQPEKQKEHEIKPFSPTSQSDTEASEPEKATPQEKETPSRQTQPSDKAEKSPVKRESAAPISLQVPEMQIGAQFAETISTERHQEGQQFFLRTLDPTYVSGHLLIPRGARVRAFIKKLRPADGRKKAFLAIEIQAVEAVNGQWLALEYPEYSNVDKGLVEFKKGQVLSKIKLQATYTSITPKK